MRMPKATWMIVAVLAVALTGADKDTGGDGGGGDGGDGQVNLCNETGVAMNFYIDNVLVATVEPNAMTLVDVADGLRIVRAAWVDSPMVEDDVQASFPETTKIRAIDVSPAGTPVDMPTGISLIVVVGDIAWLREGSIALVATCLLGLAWFGGRMANKVA